MRNFTSIVAGLVTLVAAAISASSCSVVDPFLPTGTKQRPSAPAPTTNPSSTSSSPNTLPPSAGGASTARGASSNSLPPIADKIITLAGNCSQSEEDGFREQATLSVDKNEVRSLNWQLWVGKRGSCKFDFNDFTQTKRSPNIEMVAKDGSQCRLLIWQTPDRVTLAHNGCQKRCTAGIYDDAWPVMFNPQTGSCAKLG
jgi:hypothetical protein